MARAVRTLATNAVDLRCVSSLDRPPGRISTTVLNLKRHTRAPASCSIWLVLRVSHRFDGLSTKRRSGCRRLLSGTRYGVRRVTVGEDE